eukprot:2512729-Amphidinium_carterae.1
MPGSVIVDLAAAAGGNTSLTQKVWLRVLMVPHNSLHAYHILNDLQLQGSDSYIPHGCHHHWGDKLPFYHGIAGTAPM